VVGRTAEFVLADPEARWKPEAVRLRSKSRNTPFLSRELRGRILLTLATARSSTME
jgi:dihydroorotase